MGAEVEAGHEGFVNTVLGWRDGTRKVDILNLSVGFSGIIDDYTQQQLRDNFGDAIAAMAGWCS